MKKPCDNCPWRRDAPTAYWDPDHFTEIWRNCQDDGARIMLCHKAGNLPEDEAREIVCHGWVRVVGYDAIGVRLAVMRGQVSPDEVLAKDGVELYDSFEEMMEANAIEPPARNRWVPRGYDVDDP